MLTTYADLICGLLLEKFKNYTDPKFNLTVVNYKNRKTFVKVVICNQDQDDLFFYQQYNVENTED